jgi:V/A-type H+/Na+-transporting ATPase subunit E
MDSKIQELTSKIYDEGVVKGEQRAKEIVADAQAKADKIIADAKAQADSLAADAKKKSEELRRNVDAEVKLSGQQAVAAIKQKIIDAIIAKTVDEKAAAALSKPEIIIDLVKTLLTHWKPASNDIPTIEVILPADKQAALEQTFKRDAHALLAAGLQPGARGRLA